MGMLIREAIALLEKMPPEGEIRLCAQDIVDEGGSWPVNEINHIDDGHEGGVALIEVMTP